MATPYRALQTFFWGQRVINSGDIVSSDDPVMRKHAVLFERVVLPGVEQATAAPGELRAVTRPTTKKGAP